MQSSPPLPAPDWTRISGPGVRHPISTHREIHREKQQQRRKNYMATMLYHLVGLVKVRVLRGVNLAIRDLRSSDPYVILRIGRQVCSAASPSSVHPCLYSRAVWFSRPTILATLFFDWRRSIELCQFGWNALFYFGVVVARLSMSYFT
jgi:hypothetical protein